MQTGTDPKAAPSIRCWMLLIAAATVGCTIGPSDRNADSSSVEVVSPAPSLFESAAQHRDRHAAYLSEAVARTLRDFPGTAAARVHLSLPDRSLLSAEPPSSPRAAVLIVPKTGASPPIKEIRAFVAASVPNLSPEHVTVSVGEASPTAPAYIQVGPFRAAPDSAFPLRLTLIVLLGFCMFAASGLILAGFRIRRLRAGDRRPSTAP